VAVTKRQLASAVLTTPHIAEREVLAGFLLDEAAVFAPNPFASTKAGAAHQLWYGRAIEFQALLVASAGLPCLLRALKALPVVEPLRQEIVRSPGHVLYLYHRGDGCRVVGAVLHGKPRQALPVLRKRAGRPRRSIATCQLDLFALGFGCGHPTR
jgi:hypothetical protein